jgi:hypothetical protein
MSAESRGCMCLLWDLSTWAGQRVCTRGRTWRSNRPPRTGSRRHARSLGSTAHTVASQTLSATCLREQCGSLRAAAASLPAWSCQVRFHGRPRIAPSWARSRTRDAATGLSSGWRAMAHTSESRSGARGSGRRRQMCGTGAAGVRCVGARSPAARAPTDSHPRR